MIRNQTKFKRSTFLNQVYSYHTLAEIPWAHTYPPDLLEYYPWVWRSFQQAAVRAGVPRFGTHSLRHSYRSWLDAAGTPVAVQQKLMRHSDIRTTLNIYGDVVTDEMAQANSKVAKMALSRTI
jgi:integrase